MPPPTPNAVAEKAEAQLPLVAGQAVLRQAVAVEVPRHLRPPPLGAVHQLVEEVQLRRPVEELALRLPRPPPQAVVKVAQLEPLPVGAMPRRLAQVLPRPLPEDVVPQRPVEALLPLPAPRGRNPEELVEGATATGMPMIEGSISKWVGQSSGGVTTEESGTGRSGTSGADDGTSTGSASAGSKPRLASFGCAANATLRADIVNVAARHPPAVCTSPLLA